MQIQILTRQKRFEDSVFVSNFNGLQCWSGGVYSHENRV